MRKAMILAAGRGERMGELTRQTPKPLLRVGGHYLIEYALARLKQAGINDIVINVSYLGEQIVKALGDGSQYGVKLVYSREPERLETGGGIFQALNLLGTEPFIVVSSDVITDLPFNQLPRQLEGLAHIVMVANPIYNQKGDYGLQAGKIVAQAASTLTYASVGVFTRELFAESGAGHFRLTTVLNPAVTAGKVTGEQYHGAWYNIGTSEDLTAIQNEPISI